MRAFLIASGNPLRRDDGVAHRVLQLLSPAPDVETYASLQLTPELASNIAGCSVVIFIDADVGAVASSIDSLDEPLAPPRFTHAPAPAEIIWLARKLFGFTGTALLCRIPAHDLSPAEHLSLRARKLAEDTARDLEMRLHSLRQPSM